MTDALKELTERIAEGKALVVTGTGVSIAATDNELASWTGLITDGLKRCVALRLQDDTWCELLEKLLNKDDPDNLHNLLCVAEQVSRRLGWRPHDNDCDGNWIGWLRDTVGSLRARNSELIEVIHSLGVPIATLTYDDLHEELTGLQPLTWQQAKRWLPVLEGKDKKILHLHGHWETPSSVVFGIRSYDALINAHPVQHLQGVVATTHSLLFIGCNGTFKDPNFEILLTWMREYLRGFEHHHYLLLSRYEQPAIPEKLLREARIMPMYYDGKQFADLLPFIRDLAPKCSDANRRRDSSFFKGWRGIRGLDTRQAEVKVEKIVQKHERTDESLDPLERRLRDYYGEKRCVIDGNLDVDWIPFDGDIANLSFKNLVPVGRRHLLQAISPRVRGKLSNRFRFSVYLTAEKLLCTSKIHFHTGMPALAFGCARLGEALALESAKDFKAQDDDGWAFLSQCLFYLPYRMNGDLLESTLQRVMVWLKKGSPCPYVRRSALLLSIANLYQDKGDWGSAEDLYDKILSSPGLTNETKAATLRRRMIGRFFTAPSERLLLRDISYIKDLNSDTDFLVSLAIAQGWWHIARGRPGKSLHILEPFNLNEAESIRQYSPHNIFELKLTKAAAYEAVGLRSNVNPILYEVRRYVSDLSYTRLRPIVTDRIAPVVFGHELVRAIAPLSSTFEVIPSMLDLLNEVTEALLRARCTKITGRPTWVD